MVTMGSKRTRRPAAFHDAMSVKSAKKKKGMVRGSRAAHNLKTRKDTLLIEYRNLRKANTFKDNRMDASKNDPEVKALQRFQAQGSKGKRDSKFDLSDFGGGFGEPFGNGYEEDRDAGEEIGRTEELPIGAESISMKGWCKPALKLLGKRQVQIANQAFL